MYLVPPIVKPVLAMINVLNVPKDSLSLNKNKNVLNNVPKNSMPKTDNAKNVKFLSTTVTNVLVLLNVLNVNKDLPYIKENVKTVPLLLSKLKMINVNLVTDLCVLNVIKINVPNVMPRKTLNYMKDHVDVKKDSVCTEVLVLKTLLSDSMSMKQKEKLDLVMKVQDVLLVKVKLTNV